MFIGRTDAKAETLILWPPDVKNWLIGKDPDAGKNWRQEEKGTTEDERLSSITDLMGMNLSKLWEWEMDREAWHAVVHGSAKSQTYLSDWIELSLRWVDPSWLSCMSFPNRETENQLTVIDSQMDRKWQHVIP